MRTDLPSDLARDIADCGYFPEVACLTLASAIGDETLVSHFVAQETTFDLDVVGRHLTVLALTPSRLIIGHTNESDLGEGPRAISSTEVIGLDRVYAVGLNQAMTDAASKQKASVAEAWLTIGWGVANRIDLVPAICPDPECDADHGYSGTVISDDINVRTSLAGDGEQRVARLIEFATQLQQAIGRR